MPRNELGELRRSAAANGFGPGAVIDFRADGAAISGVAAGLEEWDSSFPPGGLRHPQAVNEERLEKKLNVAGFRLAPVRDPNNPQDVERALVAVRFPAWLQCPKCDRIGREDLWLSELGKVSRWCGPCTKAAGNRKVFVVPVRFVMACENGHLDEFPWHTWVSHVEGCKNREGFLKLTAEGAGLAGIILSCAACGQRRSMDRIFTKETWERFPNCRGHRPWLAAADEGCDLKLRAAQRGASNLYFPLVESALSIPPWSNRLQEALGVWWDHLKSILPEDRLVMIESLARGPLKDVLEELSLTPEMLATEIELRIEAWRAMDVSNLRIDEYRQLTGGAATTSADEEFEIRPQPVPPEIVRWFGRIVKVVRLREVRAITGFTRIQPPGDPDSKKIASLSVTRKDWLPAVEVRGEGVFLELNRKQLETWEALPAVVERAGRIDQRWRTEWAQRHGKGSRPDKEITPRFLLLHTLAHALMRQLTLDCGYSSTALRERLYANDPGLCGLLIYTATTDDDGTLGGLARQGDPRSMRRSIEAAIRAQAWCSSDPLCIEDLMSGEEALSLAACHSCVLSPETSCEEFNRFLDRAMLVGTPADASLGFFSDLAAGEHA